MKLIEEKIHQLHEEARNKQNVQKNKSKTKLMLFLGSMHVFSSCTKNSTLPYLTLA